MNFLHKRLNILLVLFLLSTFLQFLGSNSSAQASTITKTSNEGPTASLINSNSITPKFAYIFVRPDTPPIAGHTGWGFQVADNSFTFGATEGPSDPQFHVSPGEDNGAWMNTGSFAQMIEAMRVRSYTGFKMIKVTNSNSAMATSVALQTAQSGYTLIGNNCADHTYRILSAFGVTNLPSLHDYFFPNVWYFMLNTFNSSWTTEILLNGVSFPVNPPPTSPSIIDGAKLISHITLQDTDSIPATVNPGQSYTKTWRMQNTGSTDWGSGYKLCFISGDNFAATSCVNAPSIAHGQTDNVNLPIQIPGNVSSAVHKGVWQLQNPQGTYFGDQVWYFLAVPGTQPDNGVRIDPNGYSTDCPTRVSPGQHWVCNVTITLSGGQFHDGDMLRFKRRPFFSGGQPY